MKDAMVVAWNLWCRRELQRQARAQALVDARSATWRIRAEGGVIVSELLWGLLGLVLSCVAGLALWAVYPKYPHGAGMLACIGAVLVVGAALRSRRELPAVPPLPGHIQQVSRRQQGIPRRPLDVAGAGPHSVRRATLLAPLALLLPRPAQAATAPAPRQWPRMTGPTDSPLSQALGHAWQVPGIDRAVVMVRQDGRWTWKGWRLGRAGGVAIYEPHSVAPQHGVLGKGEVPTFGPHDLDRECDLATLRADWRAVQFQCGLINASLDGAPPWFCLGDESHFTPGLNVALRCGGTAEQVLAFSASAKQWRQILAAMKPGTDVLALMRAAMEAPIDDAALLARRRENHERHMRGWQERRPKRAEAKVMAVLRGAA